MACGCADRREHLIKAALAVGRGDSSEAKAEVAAVVTSAARDLGRLRDAARARLGLRAR